MLHGPLSTAFCLNFNSSGADINTCANPFPFYSTKRSLNGPFYITSWFTINLELKTAKLELKHRIFHGNPFLNLNIVYRAYPTIVDEVVQKIL